MKNILIIESLRQLFTQGPSFLDRTDFALSYAATNDDILRRHIEKEADLIVTTFNQSALSVEELFSIVKRSAGKHALLVLLCGTTPGLQERAKHCGANVVLTLPIDRALLDRKIQELLAVAPRKAYRVVFNVAVVGKFRNRPFLCNLENISTSGMLMPAREDMEPGDRIACSFYIPDGTRVRATGEVVRVVEQESGAGDNFYGIKFIDISGEHRAALDAFIERKYRRDRSRSRPEAANAA